MEITLRRTEKKIIVGFYLEPRLWLIDAAPQNAMNVLTEVVFKSELTDSFSIYGQRQGFIVVELDQIFFNDFDGLKATIVVELFNCILFCIYEAMPGIQQRHQIELWHLWLWQDNCLQEIGNIIATQQPFPLYKDYIPFDLVNYYIGVSIGRISNHDYNFRFCLNIF